MDNITIGSSVIVLPQNEEFISHEVLKSFSSSAVFDENTWHLDKLNKGAGSRAVYFANTPAQFMVIVKEFVLYRLIHQKSTSTVASNVTSLNVFLRWYAENYRQMPLKRLSTGIVDEFRIYLDADRSRKKSSKEDAWTALYAFFQSMKRHPLMPEKNVLGKGNPFSRTTSDRLVEGKYVKEDIVVQYDKMFYGNELPLFIRSAYWICRLIPSRIGEVLSLPIDCLRQYGNDYILTLNMFKQNGGYLSPEERMIRIKYSDMGKFLVDLIKKQQEEAQSIQSKLAEESNKGFLFSYHVVHHRNGVYIPYDKYAILDGAGFRKWMETLADRYNVLDYNGNPYRLTSHQLRHNAITDRFYEGFELIAIKDMTHHKTTAMIEQSYIHSKTDQLVQIAHAITDENDKRFAGRVIQNAMRYEHIMKMPRSQRIGHIGVCCDATGCSNDMYECLACRCFVPNADDLPYFQGELESLKEKVILQQKTPYLLENTQYRIRLYECIVGRILARVQEEEEDE